MSAPDSFFLNRMLLSVSRLCMIYAGRLLVLFGVLAAAGYFLAYCTWVPSVPLASQLSRNDSARQIWENTPSARDSLSDICLHITCDRPETLAAVLQRLRQQVEEEKRLFAGSFSSLDFSLAGESQLYQIPLPELSAYYTSVANGCNIADGNWAMLDVSNFCHGLTSQLQQNGAKPAILSDITAFTQSLHTALTSQSYVSLWRFRPENFVKTQDLPRSGFFAVELADPNTFHDAIVRLNQFTGPLCREYPSCRFEMSGIPLEERDAVGVSFAAVRRILLGLFVSLSVYFLAALGSLRQYLVILLTLVFSFGIYFGFGAVLLGQTTWQTVFLSIVLFFLVTAAAVPVIYLMIWHQQVNRLPLQESVIRAMERYIPSVFAGNTAACLAFTAVFAVILNGRTPWRITLVPESTPTQWLFFMIMSLMVSGFAVLTILPAALRRLGSDTVTHSPKDSGHPVLFARQNLLPPRGLRTCLTAGTVVLACYGIVRIMPQFRSPQEIDTLSARHPLYTTAPLKNPDIPGVKIYDVSQIFPRDTEKKEQIFSTIRSLLANIPENGPEIPISERTSLDQSLARLQQTLSSAPETQNHAAAVQNVRRTLSQMPQEEYYRLLGDYQRTAANDLCQQLRSAAKQIPGPVSDITFNPEISRRFKRNDASLLLIPLVKTSELGTLVRKLEKDVPQLCGYSLLQLHKAHTDRRTFRASSILLFAVTVLLQFLLYRSYSQSFLGMLAVSLSLALFFGFLAVIPVSLIPVPSFVMYFMLAVLPLLSCLLGEKPNERGTLPQPVRLAPFILVFGGCVIFAGNLFLAREDTLFLIGRATILGWFSLFITFYLMFSEKNGPADHEREIASQAAVQEAAVREFVPPETTAFDVEEQWRRYETIQEPPAAEPEELVETEAPPVVTEEMAGKNEAEEETEEPATEEEPQELTEEAVLPKEPSFCKVWSIGRQSPYYPAVPIHENDSETQMILPMTQNHHGKNRSQKTA
jgi:hypothetical protein